MNLIVDELAADIGILSPVGAIIRNIRVIADSTSSMEDAVRKAQEQLQSEVDLDNPLVSGYRRLFQEMGYDAVRPAGERLVESFRTKGFKRYNNIVDSYNIVALRHVAGLGMHDWDRVNGSVLVSRATGRETIRPLFREADLSLRAGDLFYGDDNGVMAWLGKRDVDSNHYAVTEETRNLLLIVLGHRRTPPDYNTDICKEAYELISLTCPEAEFEILDSICQL